jgi:nitrate reductase gamma subunit
VRGNAVHQVLFLLMRNVLLVGHHNVIHDVHLALAFEVCQVTLFGRLVWVCNVAVRWRCRLGALSLAIFTRENLGLTVI